MCLFILAALSSMLWTQSEVDLFKQWVFSHQTVWFEHSKFQCALPIYASNHSRCLFISLKKDSISHLKGYLLRLFWIDEATSDTAAVYTILRKAPTKFIECLHRQIIVNFPFAPIHIALILIHIFWMCTCVACVFVSVWEPKLWRKLNGASNLYQ